MKKLKVLALTAGVLASSPMWSQTTGKALTVDDLVSWQRITHQVISDNGEWVACKMEPWKGDATVFLYGKKGEEVARFTSADKFQFSASSAYLVFFKIKLF